MVTDGGFGDDSVSGTPDWEFFLLLFQQVNKTKGNTIVMVVGHLFSKLNYNEVTGFIVLAADKRKSSPCLGSA